MNRFSSNVALCCCWAVIGLLCIPAASAQSVESQGAAVTTSDFQSTRITSGISTWLASSRSGASAISALPQADHLSFHDWENQIDLGIKLSLEKNRRSYLYTATTLDVSAQQPSTTMLFQSREQDVSLQLGLT